MNQKLKIINDRIVYKFDAIVSKIVGRKSLYELDMEVQRLLCLSQETRKYLKQFIRDLHTYNIKQSSQSDWIESLRDEYGEEWI